MRKKSMHLIAAGFAGLTVFSPSVPGLTRPVGLPALNVPGVVQRPASLPSLPLPAIIGKVELLAPVGPAAPAPAGQALRDLTRKLAHDPVAQDRLREAFDGTRARR